MTESWTPALSIREAEGRWRLDLGGQARAEGATLQEAGGGGGRPPRPAEGGGPRAGGAPPRAGGPTRHDAAAAPPRHLLTLALCLHSESGFRISRDVPAVDLRWFAFLYELSEIAAAGGDIRERVFEQAA